MRLGDEGDYYRGASASVAAAGDAADESERAR
jgi:hypothetical protein